MKRFLHFGCWNNMQNGNAVNDVMTVMKRKIADTTKPVDFISVAGDNYYPKKSTDAQGAKKKIISPEDLDNGFRELPDEPEIYMILGNHDLETNNDEEQPTLFVNDKNNPESGCNIMTLQQDSIKNLSNIHFELFKAVLMRDDTLVLMVDTSMYEDEAHEYLECYNIFLRESYSLKELRDYQEDLIMDAVRKYKRDLKNLILIGHHPIIATKVKNGKVKKPLNDIPFFTPVLANIYETIPDANFYYLCADLHLYQKGMVEIEMDDGIMSIEQHIVGTGGTKLDDEIPRTELNKVRTRGSVSYVMLEGMRSNGFLECELLGDEPEFRFHKANAAELSRRRTRNTRRREKQTRGRERKRQRRTKTRSRTRSRNRLRNAKSYTRAKSRIKSKSKSRNTRRIITV